MLVAALSSWWEFSSFRRNRRSLSLPLPVPGNPTIGVIARALAAPARVCVGTSLFAFWGNDGRWGKRVLFLTFRPRAYAIFRAFLPCRCVFLRAFSLSLSLSLSLSVCVCVSPERATRVKADKSERQDCAFTDNNDGDALAAGTSSSSSSSSSSRRRRKTLEKGSFSRHGKESKVTLSELFGRV